MGLTLDGVNDGFKRTSAPSAFTICGWFRRTGSGGGSQYEMQPAFSISNSGSGATFRIGTKVGNPQANRWGTYDSGSWDFDDLATDTGTTWKFVAVTRTGSTWKGYLGIIGSALVVNTKTLSFTPDLFEIGAEDWDDWFEGECAAIKMWDKVLTQDQLEAERFMSMPAELGNLFFFNDEELAADHLKDFSGNGNVFTDKASASITDGGAPPVGWGLSQSGLLVPIIAPGGATYNESVALTAAAAVAPTNIATLLGSVGLTGDAAVAFSNIATLLVSLGLTANATAALIGNLIMDAAVSLGADGSVAGAGGLILEDGLTLSANAAVTLAELVTIDVDVALAADAGLTAVANQIILAQASLVADAQISNTAIADLLASLGLSANGALDPAAVLIIGAQATLDAIAGLGVVDELLTGGEFFETLTLAADAGLAPAVAVVFGPSVSLAANATVVPAATADFLAAVNLAANGQITPLVNAVLEGSLSLAAVGTLNAAGAIFTGVFFDLYGRRVSATESIASIIAEKNKVKVSTIIQAIKGSIK